jgi:hypothetical protein
MGRARGTAKGITTTTKTRGSAEVFEVGRFDVLFGAGRGGWGALADDPRDDHPRTSDHPGPMIELHRNNGRLIRARIIRYGDYKGAGTDRQHEPAKTVSFKKCLADNYLVELLEDVSHRPELQEQWPNGFPFSGHYYVGTLRRGERPRESGLSFTGNDRYASQDLSTDEVERLLDWLDEQLGR